MINPQNQRITKVIETLEQMNLFAAEEITQMEDFLNGTADESAVEKLAFRDSQPVTKYCPYEAIIPLTRTWYPWKNRRKRLPSMPRKSG